MLFLPLAPFEQRVSWTHGDCGPGQGAGALAAGAGCGRGTGREAGRYQSCREEKERERCRTYCDAKESGSKKRMCLTLAVVVDGVVVRRRP